MIIFNNLLKDQMSNFEKITGPHGIPVYYQYLPEPIRSVSMSWNMFVGGADDESVGAPGLYHWFEHVPFRGTKKYPKGIEDIRVFCTKYGGQIGARTSPGLTTYEATVPIKIWKEALSRITDLMSQPTLKDESIEAEREIIFQEIAEKRSQSQGLTYHELHGILWPGHPMGHHVLGNEDTLKSMTPSILREAHIKNYDRSRCVLIVSGNIDKEELLEETSGLSAEIPHSGLPERRQVTNYGDLPSWNKGATTVRETEFSSSTVLFLFPLADNYSQEDNYFRYSILKDVLLFGATTSPLMKILREERGLVYRASIRNCYIPNGGYWGFTAETQKKNIDPLIKAFKDTLVHPSIYSDSRLNDVKTGIRGYFDLNPIDPKNYRNRASERLKDASRVYSDDEYLKLLDNITPGDIKNTLKSLNPEEAHTIIFRGSGK